MLRVPSTIQEAPVHLRRPTATLLEVYAVSGELGEQPMQLLGYWHNDPLRQNRVMGQAVSTNHGGSMNNKNTCPSCAFFLPHQHGSGECRRHAPQPKTPRSFDEQDNAVWPLVGEDDWCGEHTHGQS